MGDGSGGKDQHLLTAVWRPVRSYEISKKGMIFLAAIIVVCLLVAIWVAAKGTNLDRHQSSNVVPPTQNNTLTETKAVRQSTPRPAAATTSVSTSDQNTANSNPVANVTVNGQSVPVPENGTVKRAIKASSGGTTNVTVRHISSTSSSGSSSSDLYVSTQSTSTAESEGSGDP